MHELDLDRDGGGVRGLEHEVEVEVERLLELGQLVLQAEDASQGRYAGGHRLQCLHHHVRVGAHDRGTERVGHEGCAKGSLAFGAVLKDLDLHPRHTFDGTVRVEVALALVETVVLKHCVEAIREMLFEDGVGLLRHLVQELRQHVCVEPVLRDRRMLPATSSNAF